MRGFLPRTKKRSIDLFFVYNHRTTERDDSGAGLYSGTIRHSFFVASRSLQRCSTVAGVGFSPRSISPCQKSIHSSDILGITEIAMLFIVCTKLHHIVCVSCFGYGCFPFSCKLNKCSGITQSLALLG